MSDETRQDQRNYDPGLTDSGWCCKTCEAVASLHGDMYPETPGLEDNQP
jgi:hypothetical protein